MGRLIFKPFGLVLGFIAGRLASKVFLAVWGAIDDEPVPPKPTERDASTGRAVAAAVVQASTLAATRTIVDRAGLRAFHYLTGSWAGAKPDKGKA